jgi:hypothetical protein
VTWLNQYIDETIPAFGHESHDFQISWSCWNRAVLLFISRGRGRQENFSFWLFNWLYHTCTFLRRGGYPLVDSIKGYPKEFHWRVTRSWWLEEWFWKLSRPIPLLHFFLQSRAHSYGKHAPEMESVALHYIHLRVRAAISGRKSAGRGGTLPLNRFKNSLWDSCHLGTTCTTNLDVWLAAQCFWNTFLIFHFLSYVDCSIRNFIVM